jgi:alanine-glyoxylate transaminase/serine-glyoxylate transaminase/serine-pyruvate transaminase
MSEIDPRNLPDMPELMIAGPGELREEDLAVLGGQVIAHYGELWTAMHGQVIGQLGELMGAADAPYLIPGSGTTCLDAGVGNLFEPGQRVAVVASGFFGTRLAQIAEAHRLDVIIVPVDVGAPVDVERIADVADEVDGILSVHVDTATGVRHPVEEIARVARSAGCIYMVDGIASVGGELLDVDAMGIDCVVTASQKGLEGPPGLGVLALGAAGRDRVETRTSRPLTFYLDLKTWDRYRDEWGAWHPHPVTMPTNAVLALASSLRRILDTGVREWVAARADLAKRCREGLRQLGLEPVPHPGAEANLVVAMWADDPAAIQKHLLAKGIMISGGLDPTMGKAIRVGLMGGTASERMVERVIEGVRESLG